MTATITVMFSLLPATDRFDSLIYLHLDGASTSRLFDNPEAMAQTAMWWTGESFTPGSFPDWAAFEVLPGREAEALRFFMIYLPRVLGDSCRYQAVPMARLKTFDVIHELWDPNQTDTIAAVLLESAAS